jgi:hypothetical protein
VFRSSHSFDDFAARPDAVDEMLQGMRRRLAVSFADSAARRFDTGRRP